MTEAFQGTLYLLIYALHITSWIMYVRFVLDFFKKLVVHCMLYPWIIVFNTCYMLNRRGFWCFIVFHGNLLTASRQSTA